MARCSTRRKREAARALQICNACRYCEGFCAVFPAMTRRLEFAEADVHYLANLCHNCGACLHACQYAPPHEFAVNVPRGDGAGARPDLRRLRLAAGLGRALSRATALTVALALAAGLASVPRARAGAHRAALSAAPLAGDFYACSRTT